MRKYKQEMSTFFNEKRAQDTKLINKLKKKSFKEKQEYIQEHRDEITLEEGTFRVGADKQFEREKFIRDIDYYDRIIIELKEKWKVFTQYKYDILYELIEINQEQFDIYDAQINELKKKRDAYITRRSTKKDEDTAILESIKLQIKERMSEFKDAELEDQKELYSQVIELRKTIFEYLEPKLSIIEANGYKTLITHYNPIKGSQRNLKNLNVINNNVNIELELDELEDIENSKSNTNSSKE